MDSRIVLLLAIAVTSCLCVPEPARGSWPVHAKCACGRIYLPVCGSDGERQQSFSNMCEYECAASAYEYNFQRKMTIIKHDECDTPENASSYN